MGRTCCQQVKPVPFNAQGGRYRAYPSGSGTPAGLHSIPYFDRDCRRARRSGTVRIEVELDGLRFRITPDPARVRVGERVAWSFSTTRLSPSTILWQVYFDDGSPLQGGRTSLITSAPPTQISTTPIAIASEEGDWKYGVRAIDANSRHVLADDDPRLIVYW